MRLCRFNDNRLGIVEGPTVRDVTAALEVLPKQGYPFPTHDLLIEHLDRIVERARTLLQARTTLAADAVTLLSPVANPGKIIAAPVNFEKHRDEATQGPAAAREQSRGARSVSRQRVCFSRQRARSSVRAKASSFGFPSDAPITRSSLSS